MRIAFVYYYYFIYRCLYTPKRVLTIFIKGTKTLIIGNNIMIILKKNTEKSKYIYVYIV